MTAPISGQVTDYVGKAMADAAKSTGSKETVDKDMFLKLMVAQLKYQDPSNPQDSSQFLAQTAQFTSVEKLGAIEKSQAAMLSAQLMIGASNLIGRTVAYIDADGKALSGVVTSAAAFNGSSPTLKVGDTEVALSSVTEVRSTTTG
jgi:flagellar basal-body rod modification protein FlgD